MHVVIDPSRSRSLARLLGIAADNLDLVGLDDLSTIVELELDVLDEESPDFVAESVGRQASLERRRGEVPWSQPR
jgi:hypothetical protein